MKSIQHVGVDVSAKALVVAIEGARGEPWEGEFTNDASGHRKLLKRLARARGPVRVCVEATGIYHLDLALALHRAEGIEVMVVNPRASKDFGRAFLKRSKTDRVDARLLLEFARRMEFTPWEPPREAILALRALSRRIQALLVTRAQEKNRLHADQAFAETPAAIEESIERHLEAIASEVETLTGAALKLIQDDEELDARFCHLTSIKGIANASAITILAELAVLPADMTARQWVAHSGLDPRHHQSGTSVQSVARISKVGNRHLRAALFLPAMVAAQHEPQVRAFYRNLLGAGKKPIQALVAIMRKLLHAIHGMFRNDQDFNGAKFYAGDLT